MYKYICLLYYYIVSDIYHIPCSYSLTGLPGLPGSIRVNITVTITRVPSTFGVVWVHMA